MASPLDTDAQIGANVTARPSVSRPLPDMSLYSDNRLRLASKLSSAGPAGSAIVVLQGGEATTRHETDHEDLFRQESNFHWAFGVREPDCYGAIEVATGRSTLFIPRLPDAYRVWMGDIKAPGWFKDVYAVDDVRYVDELAEVLAGLSPSSLLLLKGFNSDGKAFAKPGTFSFSFCELASHVNRPCSPQHDIVLPPPSRALVPAASFAGIEKFAVDTTTLLWDALTECRVFKTKKEQEASLPMHRQLLLSE